MANTNITTDITSIIKDINSPTTYFKSEYVKVFPCSYRGIKDNTLIIDPESKLQTEYNFINSASVGGLSKENIYIISYDSDTEILKCVLKGYLFTISSFSLVSAAEAGYRYLGIRIKNGVALTENYKTELLSSFDDNTDYYLDKEESGINYFTGLILSKSNEENDVYFLQIIDDNGKLCQTSLLPNTILHGETENSIKFNENSTCHSPNEVVIGNYNEAPVKGETVIFAVGAGTASENISAMEITNNKIKLKTSINNYIDITKDSNTINIKSSALNLLNAKGDEKYIKLTTDKFDIKHSNKIDIATQNLSLGMGTGSNREIVINQDADKEPQIMAKAGSTTLDLTKGSISLYHPDTIILKTGGKETADTIKLTETNGIELNKPATFNTKDLTIKIDDSGFNISGFNIKDKSDKSLINLKTSELYLHLDKYGELGELPENDSIVAIDTAGKMKTHSYAITNENITEEENTKSKAHEFDVITSLTVDPLNNISYTSKPISFATSNTQGNIKINDFDIGITGLTGNASPTFKGLTVTGNIASAGLITDKISLRSSTAKLIIDAPITTNKHVSIYNEKLDIYTTNGKYNLPKLATTISADGISTKGTIECKKIDTTETITAEGNLKTNSNLTVGKDATVDGSLTVNCNAAINGDLTGVGAGKYYEQVQLPVFMTKSLNPGDIRYTAAYPDNNAKLVVHGARFGNFYFVRGIYYGDTKDSRLGDDDTLIIQLDGRQSKDNFNNLKGDVSLEENWSIACKLFKLTSNTRFTLLNATASNRVHCFSDLKNYATSEVLNCWWKRTDKIPTNILTNDSPDAEQYHMASSGGNLYYKYLELDLNAWDENNSNLLPSYLFISKDQNDKSHGIEFSMVLLRRD